MNQILFVQKNQKESNIDINKILIIFAILLIGFGIAMLGQGVYSKLKNSEYTKKIMNAIPTASFEREGQYLIIKSSHIRPIQSIKYNWNGEEEIVINGNNRTEIIEKIELPAGNNTLNIIITDVNGKQTTYSKDYSIETGKDIRKPEIDIDIVGNYVKLTVTDEKALSYVTYRWNEEEETKLQPTGADNAKIESNVEILKGRNKLTIIAVDASNNTTTREETFEGLTKPTVDVYVDGDSFLIVAKHENSIDHIEYTFNGQKYSIQYTPGPEMQYRQKMVEGHNKISVQAYSTDNTVGTYEGEYDYTTR